MESLQYLLAIYVGILLCNAAFAFLLWRRHRTELHRALLLVWTTALLSTVLQGLAQGGTLITLLGYSSAFPLTLVLAHLIARMGNRRLPWRTAVGVFTAALAATVGAHVAGAPFWLAALPVAVGTALPLLMATIGLLLRGPRDLPISGRALSVSGALFGLHCLDFPWLGNRVDMVPIAFSFGVFVLFAVSISAFAAVSERESDHRLTAQRLRLQAEERTSAQRMLFANVSHELRTPLMLITGPLEQLVGSVATPEHQRLLRLALAAAYRLLREVNLLLDVTKLEADQMQLSVAEGRVDALLESIIEQAQPHAQARGIALAFERGAELPTTVFDPDKVEVIAANLLSNALKHSEEGGSVTVRSEAGDAGMVIFEVEDEGSGIPPEHLDRIFDRFHQVQEGGPQGSGLGLPLARDFARLHGGEITVRSTEGAGSCFRVALPAAPTSFGQRPLAGEQPPAQRGEAAGGFDVQRGRAQRQRTLLADVEPASELAPRAASPAAGAPRVLWVEDHPDLRRFVETQLGSRYRVVAAHDGEEALALARSQPPDIIVSDIMMPNKDGYELVREVKADPQIRQIPVIVATARAGSEAIVEGLQLGADDYITKPFSLLELQARMEAHLRARRLGEQLDERERRLAEIGSVASAIVHDLRNPLTSIATVAERLGAELANPPLSNSLAIIDSEARRVRRMLTEIIDHARGREPQVELALVRVRSLLDDLVRCTLAQLEFTDIRFEHHLDIDADLEMAVDADRLFRLFENLIANSREAVRKCAGGGRIELSAWQEDQELAVRVSDNGPGVPPEARDAIFQPFVSHKPEGTGLGLANVHRIASCHGGQVLLEDDPSTGRASFVVRLPIRKRHETCQLPVHGGQFGGGRPPSSSLWRPDEPRTG